MMNEGLAARLARALGVADMAERLAERLPGSDLTSLLLDVATRRSTRVSPAAALRQFESDRFVTPAPIRAALLRDVISRAFAALPSGWEQLELAPLMPFGGHTAIATVAQNKVVTTTRGSEVAADPTVALAYDAALRRRRAGFDGRLVALAAAQRVTRAQALPTAARSFAHFTLLGLVCAGRTRGSYTMESDALLMHLRFHAEVALALGAQHVYLRITPLAEHGAALVGHAQAALHDLPRVTVERDDSRRTGRGYYLASCFKSHAAFGGAEPFEFGDGGDVDWTARLTSNGKERCVISGLGIDRLALAYDDAAMVT